MPVGNLQRDGHFHVQLLHREWRSELVRPQQVTQHDFDRHQAVLVADAVPGPTAERKVRVRVPFGNPLRVEPIGVEVVYVLAPVLGIPVHVVNPAHDGRPRWDRGFGWNEMNDLFVCV